MTDTYDNDASHGQEPIDINSEEFQAVSRGVIDRLTSGDNDTREQVIDALRVSTFFWDSVFNMAAMPKDKLNYNCLIGNSIGIQTAINTEVMFQATKELEA